MRNFITNHVEAIRGISQGNHVFAIDAYARTAVDCLRLLSSGLRDLALCALPAQLRWQMVPSVVKPVRVATRTGRPQAMQPSITTTRTPARLG
jgi:hypothetical protein